jgi:hypothetical protein
MLFCDNDKESSHILGKGFLLILRAVFTHGPQGPGPRVANFQGRHIKKIEIEKRLSTREKFKGHLY